MEHKNAGHLSLAFAFEDQKIKYLSVSNLREQRKVAINKWEKNFAELRDLQLKCKDLFDRVLKIGDYVREGRQWVPYGREYAKQSTAAQKLFRRRSTA